MRLDVTLHSPYLVLPQGGYLSPQSSLLVIDLGTLSMSGSTKGHLQEQCELPDQSVSIYRVQRVNVDTVYCRPIRECNTECKGLMWIQCIADQSVSIIQSAKG